MNSVVRLDEKKGVPPTAPVGTHESALPVLVSRDSFVFPGLIGTLNVRRPASRAALDAALVGNRRVLLLVQRDPDVENPVEADLYAYGTVCEAMHRNLLPDGSLRVVLRGVARAWIRAFRPQDGALWGEPERVTEFEPEGPAAEAARRLLVDSFAALVARDARIPEEALDAVDAAVTIGAATDAVAHHLPLEASGRQATLEERNPLCRAEWLIGAIARENELLDLEDALRSRTETRISDEQRNILLREKMRSIRAELGESADPTGFADLRVRIGESNAPADARAAMEADLLRLESGPSDSAEAAASRAYLETMLGMPWSRRVELRKDVGEVRAQLDASHAGLDDLKRRVLEIAAIARSGGAGAFQPLLLVGPPGVGKTSAAQAIAEALGLPLAPVALGGVRDEGEIRGHRRAYVGASVGRIAAGLRRAGASNPVMLLDEIDKLDSAGAPAAALLEALDTAQARAFVDHYLGVPVDLSGALFVATANSLETVPPALRDRFEIIELPSYSRRERLEIARRHLWPDERLSAGLPEGTELPEETLRRLAFAYGREPGVRELRRLLGAVARRLALDPLPNGPTPDHLAIWFGHPDEGTARPTKARRGECLSLMISSRGGEAVSIEAAIIPHGEAGRLTVTGLVGPAMLESARAALAALRVSGSWPEGAEVHIHAGEAGVPKDGPSAGLPLALALASAAERIALRGDVAATGEIGLNGDVRPVGGVREKLLAAVRLGVKLVLLPSANVAETARYRADLEDLEIRGVTTIAEALRLARAES